MSAFIAYWLQARFDASPEVIGMTFFALGPLQTVSFLAAARLSDRFGLLPTMVFTHLPSNLLLAAVAFAPTLAVAIVLLLASGLPERLTLEAEAVDLELRYIAGA